ncbi:hypothetical protein [Paracoccus sp. (in: a-proteobacteria)]|uniref:hypothetical protein n=1 Tax=Paracoccus sp. TaxID=267 RepID=UPI003A87733E
MKNGLIAGVIATGLLSAIGVTAEAATFPGFSSTGNELLNIDATLDYDPALLGLAIIDDGSDPDVFVDIVLPQGLTGGGGFMFGIGAETWSGTIAQFDLAEDGGAGLDSFSMLVDLTSAPTLISHAIAIFTGDLDNGGMTSFLVDGVVFAPGNLQVLAAQRDPATVIPLPATLPLIAGAFALLPWLRRRNTTG